MLNMQFFSMFSLVSIPQDWPQKQTNQLKKLCNIQDNLNLGYQTSVNFSVGNIYPALTSILKAIFIVNFVLSTESEHIQYLVKYI